MNPSATTIFFNNSKLLIAAEMPPHTNEFHHVITDEDAVFAFRMNPHQLFEPADGNVLLVTPHVAETLESIFDVANGIVAAGGLVRNETGQLLLIYRRGFWDLPKGKVDKGEKIIAAAQREVEEETGVRVAPVTGEAMVTYHAYVLKGKKCIKETHWFDMSALPGQHQLKPQTEEDIDEAIWADRVKIEALRPLMYPLINAIIP
ncbi:MAG: NUDIX domain-containing protein [Chitinophagales bacterium]